MSKEAGENAAESFGCLAFLEVESELAAATVSAVFETASFAGYVLGPVNFVYTCRRLIDLSNDCRYEQTVPDDAAAARDVAGKSASKTILGEAEEDEDADETTEYVEVTFQVLQANTGVMDPVIVEISSDSGEPQRTRAV